MTVHGDIAMHVHVSLPLGLSYSVKFCFCDTQADCCLVRVEAA